MTLTGGTQIIYVPDHAEGDPEHPDCERGFVTSVRGDVAFCRYWSKFHRGLRTVSNSESTPIRNLVVQDSVPQEKVDRLLREEALQDQKEEAIMHHHRRIEDLNRHYQLSLQDEQERYAHELEAIEAALAKLEAEDVS